MKLFRGLVPLALGGATCSFIFFIMLPNLLVSVAIPQLPFGNAELAKWQMDIPQDSDGLSGGGVGVHAGESGVPHDGYLDPNAGPPSGFPLHGPIKKWGITYDKPLLGCHFQDPHYLSHIGVDSPVDTGTPVYATMSGKVVWAGANGPWGNLVVVEANGYQTWFAHNESYSVQAGDIVQAGQEIAHSGSTGNSSGPHVHYGVKQFKDASDTTGTWLNPELFFSLDDMTPWPCSD